MEELSDVGEPLTLGNNSEHALNNGLILRHIFEHLAFEDVKNARLVSSAETWKTESRKLWRKEAALVLKDSPLCVKPPSGPGITMCKLLRELQNPEDPHHLREVPYERVKLGNSQICLSVLEEEGPAKDFWDTVGLSIKHLKMSGVRIITSGIRQTVNFLSVQMPNLESLFLDGCEPVYDDDGGWITIVQEQLHPPEDVVLPKLTTLQGTDNEDHFLNLGLRNVPNLREAKLCRWEQLSFLVGCTASTILVHDKLKTLSLWSPSTVQPESAFDYSPQVHFSTLETLKAKFNRDVSHFRFITAHAATLTKLEMFRGIRFTPLHNPICREFPVLRKLRLWGNVASDLTFLRFTPNLQLLHMDLYGFEKQEEMNQELKFVEGNLSPQTNDELIGRARESLLVVGVVLSKLEYCQINCELSLEDVTSLAEWMPNLRTLKAVLDSGALLEVCTHWKELEHLECLFGSSIGDWDIAPHEDKMAKLTDLKMLKSFTFLGMCNCSTLTDDCVGEGFLKLDQLTHLQLSVSQKFSLEAEQRLCERIESVKIDRQDCNNLQKKKDCCANMKYKLSIFSHLLDPESESDDEVLSDSTDHEL